jgi:hypothetical protein
MGLLRVYGEGVSVGVAYLTEKQAKAMASSEFTQDDLDRLEESLPIDWKASGLIDDASIEVDRSIVDATLKRPNQFNKYSSKPIAKKGRNTLAIFDVKEGVWLQVRTAGKFDISKLRSNAVEYVFPSGRGFGMNEVSYDGWTTRGGLFLKKRYIQLFSASGSLTLCSELN